MSTPDYMKINDETLVGVRRTPENTVSIYDVIQNVSGQSPSGCKNLFDRLVASYPEGLFSSTTFKF